MRVRHLAAEAFGWRAVGAAHALDRSLARLSSGRRLNSAADDVAGMHIAERLQTQYRGLNQAYRNALDGISLVNAAEGALGEIQSLLHRARDLAVQAANGTLTARDRSVLQAEMDQILREVDRVVDSTTFNGRPLLNPNPNSSAINATLIGLRSGWLEQAEALISAQYGLSGNGSAIKIALERDGTRAAWISGSPGMGGKLDNLVLHINLAQFGLEPGPDGGTGPMFNDRKVARALTQAILSQNSVFISLPDWFKSGSADFISGLDEQLNADLALYGAPAVVNAISSWTDDSIHQSSAYLAIKYLDSLLPPFTMRDVMFELSSGNDLDTALMNTVGVDTATFLADFLANGGAFAATLNLADADVGAIGGGDASAVIPNGGTYSLTPLSDFSVSWSSQLLSDPAPMTLQVGANPTDQMSVELPMLSRLELGLIGVDLTTNAGEAIDLLTHATQTVSAARGQLGSIASRLEHTIGANAFGAEAQMGSYSRIVDADFARELSALAKERILQWSSAGAVKRFTASRRHVLKLLTAPAPAAPKWGREGARLPGRQNQPN